MEAFGGKDLPRTCQTVFSKTELAQHQGSQHPMCKQDQLCDSHQPGSRSISDCSWENRRQRRRQKARLILILSQEVQTYAWSPPKKGTSNKMRLGGGTFMSNCNILGISGQAQVSTCWDWPHSSVWDTTLGLQPRNRRHVWEQCGKSWQVKAMSCQGCESACCTQGSQQLCKTHLPITTIYIVTIPRNTADLITRSLPAFTETTEGQESHHPGTEDKHSKLKGNLTGQKWLQSQRTGENSLMSPSFSEALRGNKASDLWLNHATLTRGGGLGAQELNKKLFISRSWVHTLFKFFFLSQLKQETWSALENPLLRAQPDTTSSNRQIKKTQPLCCSLHMPQQSTAILGMLPVWSEHNSLLYPEWECRRGHCRWAGTYAIISLYSRSSTSISRALGMELILPQPLNLLLRDSCPSQCHSFERTDV